MTQRLCLGTAQLGMPYGIGNHTGMPDEAEAFRILDMAWNNGIQTFDTAALYGVSEALLGRWIAARGYGADIRVVSKLPGYTDACGNPYDWALSEVKTRCRILGIDTLEGVLLHRGADMAIEGVWSALKDSVTFGYCRTMGISAYFPEEAWNAIGIGATALQVTCNILDNRFEESGVLDRCKEQGIMVYARSPFLQGLLLMGVEAVPSRLDFARTAVRMWQEGVRMAGMTPLAGALGYCLSKAEIDYVVMGAETVAQLEEILDQRTRASDTDALLRLAAALRPVDERIILPFRWPTGKADRE